jgi:cardiolipin synthase
MKGARADGPLLAAVRAFVERVETGTTRKIVRRLMQLEPDATPEQRDEALAVAVSGDAGGRLAQLHRAWKSAPNVAPQSLGWALASAEAMDEWHRTSSQADLVWTGPLGPGSTFRRTDQALLEVIERAKRRLLVVSFAVYRIEAVQRALIAATDRGVTIQLLLETNAASGGRYGGDPLSALHTEVVDRVDILVWPLEQRPRAMSRSGEPLWGVLHAKCALADEHLLLVSSANLTEAALGFNIELGVLIEGGELPSQVGRHFAELVQQGALSKVVGRVGHP